MNPETTDTDSGFDPSDPALHLEYLYGPQWREVVKIVERAAQLTSDEIELLNVHADKGMPTSLSGSEGLAGLLSNFRKSTDDSKATQIAADTAKEFGRTRAVQVAGLIAGQAISPMTTGDSDGFGGLLKSLGALGALTTVNRAVIAAVLGDLIGRGDFTDDIYHTLMDPWSDTIF
ncbi:hypothetical protein [Nocardia sp. NPDC049149]|uniref:hypothetical protein n=1 Tax=Nocardia sp. NPDC049149 TaxID=3364315 RepID=UPI0037148250